MVPDIPDAVSNDCKVGPGDLSRHFGELGRSEHKGEESSRRVAVYIVRYIDFELPFIYPSPYHPINMGDRTSLKGA